ncbi:MAG: outer membrane beta-barrel protein [Bacteroidota bacterium]
MKKLICLSSFISIIIVSFHPVSAQYSINGKIIGQDDMGISYANVLLLNDSDSSFIKGSVTDDQGNYSISNVQSGDYIIQSYMVGYSKTHSPKVQIGSSDMNVPPILLSVSTTELDEVTVQAEKPLYEQTIDRMVINVETSPVLAGNTVLEVLEKSPGVLVDRINSSISISGKNGVNVMINGKMSRMSPDALYAFLQSTPAQNVAKIELITTPPANFDAEGNAGFINIVLKRYDYEGVNGSFNVTAGSGRREKYQAGGNINYRTKNFNLFANYSFNHLYNKAIWENHSDITNQQYTRVTNTRSVRVGGFDMSTGRIGADYYLGEKTIIGVMSDIYYREWNGETQVHTTYNTDPGVDTLLIGSRENINPRKQFLANFNIQHKFTEKAQLDINLDYLRFSNDQDQLYKNDFQPQDNSPNYLESVIVNNANPTRFWIGKIDYSLTIGEKSKFETGAKATLNTLSNEIRTDRLANGQYANDPFFSFFTDVTEDIYAGYLSYNTSFGETSFKSGLRYEHTITDIRDASNQSIVYRNYGRLFPTIYISRKLAEKSSMNLSYNARINRPAFLQLTPSPIFLDPRTFTSGNTQLWPVFTHTIRATWVWNKIITSIEYNRINNEIGRQPEKLENSDQIIQIPINLDKSDLIVFNLSLPIIINDWWEMNNNLGIMYKKVESTINNEFLTRTVTVAIGNSNQRFKLGKKFSAEISGFYYSGYLEGLFSYKPYFGISAGFRKQFEGNGGSLSLNISDIFKTMILTAETATNEGNLIFTRRNNFDTRVIGLTYSRNFGNKKLKSRSNRKGGAEEDLQRI